MTESRALALWLGCLLFAMGCAFEGYVVATVASFAATVCATILVKGGWR